VLQAQGELHLQVRNELAVASHSNELAVASHSLSAACKVSILLRCEYLAADQLHDATAGGRGQSPSLRGCALVAGVATQQPDIAKRLALCCLTARNLTLLLLLLLLLLLQV
jgi:hypothetical protein